MSLQPFTVSIPDSTLEDLKDRLARTRWPDEVLDSGWLYGTNLSYLQELTNYWANEFDWRKQEAYINTLPQFTTEIDGIKIHFVHARSKQPASTPLILTHGWPDSFYRYHKVIPMLTDVFDVVVPSMPGFGFSDRTALSSNAVADLWVKLMASLGYPRFVAEGGDMGTGITMAIARQHPDSVLGIHLPGSEFPNGHEDRSTLSETEQKFVDFIQGWMFTDGAYAMVHITKPQTIAYALNDSPTGLAAWILSFINTGAENNDVEKAFGNRDDLLTNLTIYWATQTAGSAARTYYEDAHAQMQQQAPPTRIEAPATVAVYPRDAPFPREWTERTLNVRRFTNMPRGGHFPSLEEPELFVESLKGFLGDLRE